MRLAFPFGFDAAGRTATTDHARWIRGLLEQLLLTSPGERVMRPDFGGGALALVFAGAGPELAATVRLLVEGAVRGAMAGLISLEALDVEAGDGVLTISLSYVVLETGARATDRFALPAGGAP